MNILPSSEVRDKISLILKQVEETGEPVFITQYSRPKAVLVDFKVYNQLMKDIEDMEDIRDMVESQKEPGRSFDEYLKERKKKKHV
jgi:prevent-host-death family protein